MPNPSSPNTPSSKNSSAAKNQLPQPKAVAPLEWTRPVRPPLQSPMLQNKRLNITKAARAPQGRRP